MNSSIAGPLTGSQVARVHDWQGREEAADGMAVRSVLVAYASKHGSTVEIAAQIAGVIGSKGLKVRLLRAADVTTVGEYEAVILGSGVYMGRWLDPARDLAAREALALRERDLWLFSTGPIGDPPKPAENAVDVSEIVALTRPREHRLFEGKLAREELGFVERALVGALRVPDGDFRKWDEINAWADAIGTYLSAKQGASRL